MRTRLPAVLAAFAIVVGLPLATIPAHAAVPDPNASVAPGGKWFSGGLVGMWGLNCSIIGGNYNEMMIQAYAGYGGASGGGVPKVNDTFYAVINLSEPGNPCGTGISVPELRLSLPAGVSIDASRPIRCFVTPRFRADVWEETTNAGDWSIPTSGAPITGPWCRQTPYSLGNNTFSIGTPAMANGTMHRVFVPVRATGALTNANLAWEIRDPLTSEGSVTSTAGLYVFTQSYSQPTFFLPDKAAIPYWDKADVPDRRSKVEFFINLYTAGQTGYLCYDLRSKNTDPPFWSCDDDTFYDGTVQPGEGVVQLLVPEGSGTRGPNGGYAPVYFNQPFWGKDFQIRWRFRNSGNQTYTSSWIDFRSLEGPDGDGDGVVDAADSCPAIPGTKKDNGCPPALPPDSDGDGLVGVADKCPDQNGKGSVTGCPVDDGTPPTVTKTLKVPAKLRGAKGLRSASPSVCTVSGKGKKAKVVQLKPGKCSLIGTKKGKKVRVTRTLR